MKHHSKQQLYALREEPRFTELCQNLNIRRIDQARLGVDWAMSKDPYVFEEVPGFPGYHVALITAQAGTPEMRWYYKITTEGNCTYVDLVTLSVTSEDPDDPI